MECFEISFESKTVLIITTSVLLFFVTAYVIYQRFFHPLANYPGPFLASLTNGWKGYYIYKLSLHEQLLKAHIEYGPVVRVGPKDLHLWNADAIAPIYKSGRKMAKTEFYDGFTAFRPNLFGGRDEDIHSLRRRQLSHGFSQASIWNMESLIDDQMKILIDKLKRLAEKQGVFDLKRLIAFYVFDILGDVAFGRSFNAQISEVAPEIPAINDHILLSCLLGTFPFRSFFKRIIPMLPIPWLRHLMESRGKLKETCADCVRNKRQQPSTSRSYLMQHLVDAKDPETDAKLTDEEVNSEAWAMLIAGSHSTSGTLSLLFWHLIHNDQALQRVDKEIQDNLGDLPGDSISYPIQGLESSLSYTAACIQESFRISPTFTMCLWRRVLNPGGVDIGGCHIPQNTNLAISNYALHHNPKIWGADTKEFTPERFLGADGKVLANNLIHFSVGHRMCIGRHLAMMNIWKTLTTLVNKFEFHLVSAERRVRVESSGIGEMEGPFLCTVKLKGSDM
ncbi:putative cytochrome P450 [Daldinia caldariorum]|uniref:putative cytochrome P450 n=1 Tax=Daldinia caldariorum TaxID=326644 RepID=UPI002007B651|nr:putative cytochrome P450 [Daldinia caldariorum]KAI1472600.1 putative cytochrome P450 [Daldinia caldariorum]